MGWLVRDRSDRLLVLAFVPVVGVFLIGLLIGVINASHVRSMSETIHRETMPRIERLSAVRKTTDDTKLALSEYVHSRSGGERQSAGGALDAVLAQLDHDLASWKEVAPRDAGEQPLVRRVETSVVRFRNAVHRTRVLTQSDQEAAEEKFGNLVIYSANEVADAVATEIEVEARRAQELARSIQSTRYRTVALSFGLAVACVVLGVSGALLLRRDRRQRRALTESHVRQQQDRVDELEQFAGRLAHDIRNPLSTAMLAADLIQGDSQEGATRQLAERIRRSLTRAEDITESLLVFARAGGRPDPGALTDVREVVREITSDFAPEADRARVRIIADPIPGVAVACSPGVYVSMLINLLRNALKYMGDRPERTITVRVSDRQAMVRTEVIDTGPGIAPALADSVFDPYFRGATSGQRGLGLGLATVKRLAEGHGGQVGLVSTLGVGSTFWFELPHAGPSDEIEADLEDDAQTAVLH